MPETRTIFSLLHALYIIMFGFVILALWNPSLPLYRSSYDLLILLDDSLSMDDQKKASDWIDISNAAASLPDGSRTRLLRFATTSIEPIKPFMANEKELTSLAKYRIPASKSAVDSTASNIEAAINHALRLTSPDRENVMLLITDGKETNGTAEHALSIAKQNGITVYGFRPLKLATQNRADIVTMNLPSRARLGERIPVDITLTSTFTGDAQIQLLLGGISRYETGLRLQPGKTQHRLWIDLDTKGANLIELRMRTSKDKEMIFDSRKSIINVQGPISVLYVSAHSDEPIFSRSLRDLGILVRKIKPNQFPHHEFALRSVSTIILDDIAISDMPETAWLALTNAVQDQGNGLIVLGGANSFSAGGYRRSVLENILPVTAQSRQRQQPAAIQFLVDKSGSMDSDPTGVSRIALARQSVMETTRALAESDLIGLLTFDVQPHMLLPIKNYHKPLTSLEKAWELSVGGGTKLSPALDVAINRLIETTVSQKLLVLVTDGFVSDENLRSFENKISESSIDFIALAVGSEVETSSLQRLTRINNGKLVHINQIARLPRIMRDEVEKRRNPVNLGDTNIISTSPLPFMPNINQWPSLSGYMVTSERPGSNVYLRSETGDPLLVMQYSGAGKVVAIPGGLSNWAHQWIRSPHWGKLVNGIVSWVAANHHDPTIHAQIIDQPGYLKFTIDSLSENLEWENDRQATVFLRKPNHDTANLTLEQIAPGRYEGKLEVYNPGRYKANLRIGNKTIQHELLHGTHSEFNSNFSVTDKFSQWQNAGLIKEWKSGQPIQPSQESSSTTGIRPIATLFALLTLIVLLVYERGVYQLLNREAAKLFLSQLVIKLAKLANKASYERKAEGVAK